MERDIVTIVAEKLKDAQQDHIFAMQAVESAQERLDEKNRLLYQVEVRLNDIEEIHNAITRD